MAPDVDPIDHGDSVLVAKCPVLERSFHIDAEILLEAEEGESVAYGAGFVGFGQASDREVQQDGGADQNRLREQLVSVPAREEVSNS